MSKTKAGNGTPISFVRISTAAKRLGVHRATVCRKVAAGKLPRLVRLWPDGPRGFVAEEFESFLKKQVEAA